MKYVYYSSEMTIFCHSLTWCFAVFLFFRDIFWASDSFNLTGSLLIHFSKPYRNLIDRFRLRNDVPKRVSHFSLLRDERKGGGECACLVKEDKGKGGLWSSVSHTSLPMPCFFFNCQLIFRIPSRSEKFTRTRYSFIVQRISYRGRPQR